MAGVARERPLSLPFLRRPRRLSLLNRKTKRKRDETPLSARIRRRQGWGSDTSPSKRKWNFEIYGHIGHRKRLLANRIAKVQAAPDRRSSIFFLNREHDLWIEYETVLDEEESLRRQKSRVD
ncbi:hypothetical protein GOBAR_DD23294 [Gossypium barbadense]|nr:hypothetical protein GOBAR_DD23294 [Gossypium barbadense]